MKKIIIAIICGVALFCFGTAYAAQNFTINDSKIVELRLNVLGNGDVEITLVGFVLDDTGGEHYQKSLQLTWDDLPSSIKNNFNSVMKHLSKEYNNYWASENSETWVDK